MRGADSGRAIVARNRAGSQPQGGARETHRRCPLEGLGHEARQVRVGAPDLRAARGAHRDSEDEVVFSVGKRISGNQNGRLKETFFMLAAELERGRKENQGTLLERDTLKTERGWLVPILFGICHS